MKDENRCHVLEKLGEAIRHLEARPGFFRLIPEVGSNFVFCLPHAKDLTDVAGLTGRIIRVRNNAKAVGEVDFGWAPFMGRVILEAHHLDHRILSAISLRTSADIIDGAHRAELIVREFELPIADIVPDCLTVAA